MDLGVESLKKSIADVECVAEELLLAKQKVVDCDKQRNSNREALTALRKLAKKLPPGGKRLVTELPAADSNQGVLQPATCRTCGDYDGGTPGWVALPGVSSFVRLPFHQIHSHIEREQDHVEVTINAARSEVKEKTLVLSERGALSGRVGPSLIRALVTLKDSPSSKQDQ